jgi:hypothetical protein
VGSVAASVVAEMGLRKQIGVSVLNAHEPPADSGIHRVSVRAITFPAHQHGDAIAELWYVDCVRRPALNH